MPRSKAQPSLDDLRAVLRDAGLRSTNPRVAVLQHFHANRAPLSHGELVEVLADHGFDAATIYRNLTDLTGAEHPHFVCIQCGEVSCLSEVRVKLSPAPGSIKSVVNSISDIVIKGHCTQCA